VSNKSVGFDGIGAYVAAIEESGLGSGLGFI
jgi:hypothetical protein